MRTLRIEFATQSCAIRVIPPHSATFRSETDLKHQLKHHFSATFRQVPVDSVMFRLSLLKEA